MIRSILILLIFISFPSFAEYKGLKKLSKNNSFMDDTSCFTNFVKENKYFIKYLESLS